MSIKRQVIIPILITFLLGLFQYVLTVYFIFLLFWGLNYHRLGIASELGLQQKKYTTDELCSITDSLISKLNSLQKQKNYHPTPKNNSFQDIFIKTKKAYETTSKKWAFLQLNHTSLKSSSFSKIGGFLGFTGYFNPFTGEGQVRKDIPSTLLPFVACHETAHQLGYANESEANFVGYLAATNSNDINFQFSAYLELYSYTREELYSRNTFPSGSVKLDSSVIKDLLFIRNFFKNEETNLSPALSNLYNAYLKTNQYGSGIESYNEVVDWLIAYHRGHPL